jgi:hypothetical protein
VTADVSQKYMLSARVHFEIDDSGQGVCCGAMRIRTTERWQQEYPEAAIPAALAPDRSLHATAEYPEAAITMTGSPDRNDLRHSKNIPESRIKMISCFPNSLISTGRQKRTETQARFHTPSDHGRKWANGAVHLTTMPSALLARRLRSSLWCQKQVVAGDRGRSARKYDV